MVLQSGLRILTLVIAPALLSVSIDRDITERPRIMSIYPQKAAPAEIVKGYGVNLDQSHVAELLLEGTDGTTLTHIIEQRPDLIRFRVPIILRPGEYRVILVADYRWKTELIEQDIVLTVVSMDKAAL